jgi:hypothetical protein
MSSPQGATLRLLSEQRFIAFNRWLRGTGADPNEEAGREATGIVFLNHPDPEVGASQFHAKMYSAMSGRSRGLANEVVGYILAQRYGLQQPYPACIARVPLKRLDLAALPRCHAWLRDLAKVTDHYPAFCTRSLSAPTPWAYFGEKAVEAMLDELRRWPNAVRAMAFDDIIANVDRNLRNLLRTGECEYALIDHGRLVADDGHWTAAHLDPTHHSRNKLLDTLYPDPTPVRNHLIAEAENHTPLLTGLHEVGFWLSHLVPGAEARAFDSFLQARTISSSARLKTRYNAI